MSDFGLVDAIESGIVKIPRIPVDDDVSSPDEAGRPDRSSDFGNTLTKRSPKRKDHSTKDPNLKQLIGKQNLHLRHSLDSGSSVLNFMQRSETNSGFRPCSLWSVIIPKLPIYFLIKSVVNERKMFHNLMVDQRKKLFTNQIALLPELANSDNFRPTIQIDSKMLQK